eukprot:g13457.t1
MKALALLKQTDEKTPKYNVFYIIRFGSQVAIKGDGVAKYIDPASVPFIEHRALNREPGALTKEEMASPGLAIRKLWKNETAQSSPCARGSDATGAAASELSCGSSSSFLQRTKRQQLELAAFVKGNPIDFMVFDNWDLVWGDALALHPWFSGVPAASWASNARDNFMDRHRWQELASESKGSKRFDKRRLPNFGAHYLPNLDSQTHYFYRNESGWKTEKSPVDYVQRDGKKETKLTLNFWKVTMEAGQDNSIGIFPTPAGDEDTTRNKSSAAVELAPWGVVMARSSSTPKPSKAKPQGQKEHDEVKRIRQKISEGGYDALVYFALGSQGWELSKAAMAYLLSEFEKLGDMDGVKSLVYMAVPDSMSMTEPPHSMTGPAGKWAHAGPSIHSGTRWTLEKDFTLPKNVLHFKFPPQQAILDAFANKSGLRAKNTKLIFIAHCGNGGMVEAMGSQVPVLGLPMMYEDQAINCNMAEELGIGRNLAGLTTAIGNTPAGGTRGPNKYVRREYGWHEWRRFYTMAKGWKDFAASAPGKYNGQSPALKKTLERYRKIRRQPEKQKDFYERDDEPNGPCRAPESKPRAPQLKDATGVLSGEARAMLADENFFKYIANMQPILAEAETGAIDENTEVSAALEGGELTYSYGM